MIHLKLIQLTNFKGVSRLDCEFDDLTLLAGLNNSGKTSILQGVYLLFSALPRVAQHSELLHENDSVRTLSLHTELSTLGLRDTAWLSSVLHPEVIGSVVGTFANGLTLELGIVRNSANFVFKLSNEDASPTEPTIKAQLFSCANLSAALLTPPGDVPSRETMVTADDYQNRLRMGQGAQLWRNSIWWAIQKDGFEAFTPVQEQIKRYFPDVDLMLPTLSTDTPPEIRVHYKEKGRGPLDIAQSGAGLRTFISLARILQQSPADMVLLDEPDSHLHASQQNVIVDLILDAAATDHRQVIIASHSPEVIRRIPPECLRWVDRGLTKASGGYETSRIMEHLGVSPELYLPGLALPETLIYVEGVDDRPIIESLIKWCRSHSTSSLPSTLVVPHRDGRFQGTTLQGIVRFSRELKKQVSVVGIRDLDWYYEEQPKGGADIEHGDGWRLITLPCKELENLFCEEHLLAAAFDNAITLDTLRRIIDEESAAEELVNEWRYQIVHRIRERLPKIFDPSTKEQKADEIFAEWRHAPDLRRRLVAGKSLLRRVRQTVRKTHQQSFYPSRIFEKLDALSPSLMSIATTIFPDFDPLQTSRVPPFQPVSK